MRGEWSWRWINNGFLSDDEQSHCHLLRSSNWWWLFPSWLQNPHKTSYLIINGILHRQLSDPLVACTAAVNNAVKLRTGFTATCHLAILPQNGRLSLCSYNLKYKNHLHFFLGNLHEGHTPAKLYIFPAKIRTCFMLSLESPIPPPLWSNIT